MADARRHAAAPAALFVLVLLATASWCAWVLHGALSAAPPVATQRIDQALRSAGAEALQPVALPDWPEAAPGTPAAERVRYTLTLPATGAPGAHGVLLRGLIAHADIWIDGQPLRTADGARGSALPRGLARIVLLPVPAAPGGTRSLVIELRPQARASVSAVDWGPLSELQPLHDRLRLAVVLAPMAAAAVVLSLGLCVLWLWMRLREPALGWFGSGALVWAVQTLMPLLPWPDVGGIAYAIAWESLYGPIVALFAGFSLQLSGRPWPRAARWLAGIAFLGPLWLWLAHVAARDDVVSGLWRAALIALIGVALARVAWPPRRLGRPAVAVALAGGVALAFGAYDWWRDLDPGENNPVRLTTYAGLLFAVVIVGVLIERHVQASREGERLNRELESRVAMQGTQLREALELMRQARDAAQTADQAKSAFLAAASHDLRQPMHAIGLLVSLLHDRLGGAPDDPQLAHQAELRSLADRTLRAVQSMDGLFAGLLDISRLEAGAVVPRPRATPLQDLLDRLRSAYGPLAGGKGLALRMRPTRLHVHTDPELLERIAGNLLGNAIRYTRRGGVLVAVRRRGTHALLQVVDTGVGIPVDQRERIFGEFVRLPVAGAGDEGLGLGLAIVRRSAALLALPLRVRSQPGRGSVFELELTIAAPAGPVDDAPQPLGADRAWLRGAFVLVVDDDAAGRTALAERLRAWGCLVADAASGEDALVEADRHLRAPDLLLCDLRLGSGMDGLELVQRLRQRSGTAVPALLLTADLRLPAGTHGDAQVLHKPVEPARLLRHVTAALAASAARGDTPA